MARHGARRRGDDRRVGGLDVARARAAAAAAVAGRASGVLSSVRGVGSSEMLIQLFLSAYRTAWVRPLTASLRRMLETWLLTVASLIDSASPTLLFVRPCAIASRISASRGDSGVKAVVARSPIATSPRREASRKASSTRRATTGRAATAASIRYSPSATARIVRSSSLGRASSSTWAATPAWRAAKSSSSLPRWPRRTTGEPGLSRFRRWTTGTISEIGTSVSTRTTSGVSSRMIAIASSMSAASATMSMSGWLPTISRSSGPHEGVLLDDDQPDDA